MPQVFFALNGDDWHITPDSTLCTRSSQPRCLGCIRSGQSIDSASLLWHDSTPCVIVFRCIKSSLFIPSAFLWLPLLLLHRVNILPFLHVVHSYVKSFKNNGSLNCPLCSQRICSIGIHFQRRCSMQICLWEHVPDVVPDDLHGAGCTLELHEEIYPSGRCQSNTLGKLGMCISLLNRILSTSFTSSR